MPTRNFLLFMKLIGADVSGASQSVRGRGFRGQGRHIRIRFKYGRTAREALEPA